MITFRKKKIAPNKRICLRLKEAREKKEVSLKAMAKKTKISIKHLEALEACEFDKLPKGLVYQKNFVKNYLKTLGINPRPFLKQFIDEEVLYMKSKKEEEHPKKHIKSMRFGNLPALLRFAAFVLVIILFVVYLGLQVKNIIEPPELSLFSPQNGYVSEQSSVVVRGETEKGTRISINGKEITLNESSQFEEMIDLNPGLNTITVTVAKKHGKQTTETRYVVLKEDR